MGRRLQRRPFQLAVVRRRVRRNRSLIYNTIARLASPLVVSCIVGRWDGRALFDARVASGLHLDLRSLTALSIQMGLRRRRPRTAANPKPSLRIR